MKHDEQLVDAVARAIAGQWSDEMVTDQGGANRPGWTYFRHQARNVLDVINASCTHRVGVMHLTHPPHDVELAGQASADEIEVTPEMVGAGVACIMGHPFIDEPSIEEYKVIVTDVFRAMTAECRGYRTAVPTPVESAGGSRR